MRNVEFDPRYLLLMEAGARQRKDPGPLPAWDRYNTPLFRYLRTWRDAKHALPTILIVSPLHGVIGPMEPIEPYDEVLEEDVAALIADDPDNRALFRAAFTQAQRTVCVSGRRCNLIFRQWLEEGEHYQFVPGTLSHKGEVMRKFMESVPPKASPA